MIQPGRCVKCGKACNPFLVICKSCETKHLQRMVHADKMKRLSVRGKE